MPLQKRKLSQSQTVLKLTSQLEYKVGHIIRQNNFAVRLSKYQSHLLSLQAHCSRLRKYYPRPDRQYLLFSGQISPVFLGTPLSLTVKRMGTPSTSGLSLWEAKAETRIRHEKEDFSRRPQYPTIREPDERAYGRPEGLLNTVATA
jgi:hypothetical protein